MWLLSSCHQIYHYPSSYQIRTIDNRLQHFVSFVDYIDKDRLRSFLGGRPIKFISDKDKATKIFSLKDRRQRGQQWVDGNQWLLANNHGEVKWNQKTEKFIFSTTETQAHQEVGSTPTTLALAWGSSEGRWSGFLLGLSREPSRDWKLSMSPILTRASSPELLSSQNSSFRAPLLVLNITLKIKKYLPAAVDKVELRQKAESLKVLWHNLWSPVI